jgi:hypothetical protein
VGGDFPDALGVAHGRAAKLLNDERHAPTIVERFGTLWGAK